MSVPEPSPKKKSKVLISFASAFFGIPLLLALLVVGWLILFFNTAELYGYVNHQGRFVIKPQYDSASEFKNGFANIAINIDRNKGCESPTHLFVINTKGEQVTPYEYYRPSYIACQGAKPRKEPVSSSRIEPEDTTLQTLVDRESKKEGYKKREGTLEATIANPRWAIAARFDAATAFTPREVAWVAIYKSQWPFQAERFWGLIDKKGNYLLSPKCIEASNFYDDLALCKVKVYFGIFY